MGPSGGPITKDNTSVEYYGTIFTFAESPSDGKGCSGPAPTTASSTSRATTAKTWSNVTPEGDARVVARSASIDASPHDAGTRLRRGEPLQARRLPPVPLQHDRLRQDVDARSRAGIPADAFTRVVREDPKRRGLLYAGTEPGVYVSFDDGATWQPLQRNLPGGAGHRPAS